MVGKRKSTSKSTVAKKRTKRYSAPKGPLGQSIRATLIYHESFDLSVGTAGLPGFHVFSANGVFDPSITTGGHQPRGFDQLMSLYDHCVVIGSKIELICANADTLNTNLVAIVLRDTVTQFTNADAIMESRYLTYAPIAIEGGGPAVLTLTDQCNPNEFLGRSKPLADPDLKNSDSANPIEGCHWHCYAIPMQGATDTAVVHCRVRITYEVVFIEPITPNIS